MNNKITTTVSKTIILLALASGSITTAYAADWQLIDKRPMFDLYIDSSLLATDSTGKKLGDIRKVKTLMSYENEQRDSSGHKFFSESFIDSTSCSSRTRILLSHTLYSGKKGTGKIINSGKVFPLKISIEPGSMDELILGEANCSLISGKWG